MKPKQLILFVLFAVFATVAKAQIEEGTYYIQNVESGAFLSGANAWGTQASATVNGEQFAVAAVEGGYTITGVLLSSTNKTLGYNLFIDTNTSQNGNVWTIAPVEGEEGVYTIWGKGKKDGVEEAYEGYIAQSNTLGDVIGYPCVASTEVTDAAKWRFLTRERAIANIKAGDNVTFLFDNANFTRSHSIASWTIDEGCTNKNLTGGANNNTCAESYHSIFNIHQTVNGLPNGTYIMTAQGFYRQDGSDNENLAVFYANGSEAALPLKTGTENSMTDASGSFTQGLYTIDPIEFMVTDGTVTLGVKNESNTALWCIWDNFQITYMGGSSDEAIVTELSDAISALKTDATYGTDVKAKVEKVIADAQKANTHDEMVAAINALIEVKAEQTASINLFKHLSNTCNEASSLINRNAYPDASEEKKEEALRAIEDAISGMTTGFTDNEARVAEANVIGAVERLKVPANISNATPNQPVDISNLIENPSFEELGTSGWENNGSMPLMIQPNSAFAKTGEYYAERWHVSGTFDLNQSISDIYQLPAGYYRITADVFSEIDDATIYINGEEVVFGRTEGDAEIDRFRATAATYVPAQSTITIGVKGTLTSDTWFCVDNFRLVYYGTEGIGDEEGDEPSNGPEEITEDVPFYQIAGVPTPDDAVDLGLSVKWAPYNLGTSATNKYGSYYPLGSLVEQDGTVNQTDAEFNGNTDQELCDLSSTRFDATTDQWGIGWRLPTIDELKELQEKTTVKSVILSGVKGYMVTSKVNGNTIFIPASGRIPFQGTLGNVDTAAYLWSGNHQGLSGNGWSLTNNGWSNSLQSLSMGYSMRPVYDAKDDYKRNGGIYYLYNKEADMFLERGEAWGGQATLGKYGLPVRIASASTSASTDKITRLRMYDTGKSFGLGDNLSDEVFLDSKYSAMRTYRMTTTADGVTFTDENGLAVYIDGKVLKASTSRTPAVWQLVTKAEHDKMLADAAEKHFSDAFTAAGVNMTAELIETDYTNAIASASLKGSSDGWTWTPKLRVGTHTTSAYCFEGYKAQGTLSQTVTGLAPGLYKLSANAMFRNGSNKFMTDMKTDGYTPSTAYLQANGYQARVASWAEYNTAANVPNSMAEFDQVVTANPDNYKVTLYTVVGADGKLDISFVQDDFVGYGWFAVNNVQLNFVEEDGYDFPEDAIAKGEVGTCVWYITGGNELVIAPTDGVSGDLPEEGWNVDFDPDLLEEFVTIPWYYYSNRITSAKIMQGVNAKSCSYMFYGLSKMESLDLSNFNTQNVTNLTNMFANCSNLTTIISNNEIPAPLKTGTFESLPTRATCTLQVPTGTKALYAAADGWNELGIIDDGLKYALNVEGNVTLASLTGYADKFNVSNNSTGRLTVDIATGSRIGDYVQQASGSAIFNQAVSADNVSVEIDLVPKQWKFISFPYNVKVADIQKPANAVFTIRKYSGEKRANGEDAWVKVGATETLNANEGYIISADNGSTAQIKMTFPAAGSTTNFFGRLAKDMMLASHSSAKVADCDWNFIGNPFPSYYTTQSISEDVVLTVWNGSGYTAYSTVDDNYMLKPFEAFFIQSPLNVESISLPAGGRSHGTATTAARLRHSGMSSNRTVLNFVICDSDSNTEESQSVDRARIVINESASSAYEAGRDAAKFMSIDKSVPQIFVVSNGESLAIDERPMANGHATLGVYSEEETDYILSLKTSGSQSPRTSEPIYIIDNVTGTVTDLTTSDYRFTATAGTDSNRFTVVLNGETDGIEEIHNSQSTMHNYYNLAGQRINNAKTHKGIVIVNGKKVTIK